MNLEALTLNGKPIILEKKSNGKYEITKEELSQIIDQAYNAGLSASSGLATPTNPQPIPVNPITPSPTTPIWPNSPFWYDKIYCGDQTPNAIPTNYTVSVTDCSHDSTKDTTVGTKTCYTVTTNVGDKKNGK